MLQDFVYQRATKFIFGKDAEKKVGAELKELGATCVMIVRYGGKDNAYENKYIPSITKDMEDHGMRVIDFEGVQPNPVSSLCRKGIKICKEEGVDFLLAFGGGSAIDTAKAIGLGVYYEGDFWDLASNPFLAKKMVPVGVVLTYPATGSEASKGVVVTSDDDPNNRVKASLGSPVSRPTIAFENPELTYTLPQRLTACGIADMYVHILERFFTNIDFGSMDYIAEGLLKALIEYGPKLLKDPNNYDLRAEIMWIGSIAHDDTCGVGRPQDWSTHALGHELSALYDTTHAISLTVVGPAWMKYVYKENVARFARYARNVYGIKEDDDEKAALAGIKATEDFYHELGLPTSFTEAGIPTDQFEHMANQACAIKGGSHGCFKVLKPEDDLAIYRLAV